MTIFIVLALFIIIVLATIGKKKTTPSNSSIIINNRTTRKPSDPSFELSHKYFGNEWQKFIKNKTTNFNLPNNFHNTIAFSLEKLSTVEHKKLLLTFLEVSSKSDNLNGIYTIKSEIGLSNYENLHKATFNLLQSGGFSEANMLNLFRQQISLMDKHLKDSKSNKQDQSIIDVSDGFEKNHTSLISESQNQSVTQPVQNNSNSNYSTEGSRKTNLKQKELNEANINKEDLSIIDVTGNDEKIATSPFSEINNQSINSEQQQWEEEKNNEQENSKIDINVNSEKLNKSLYTENQSQSSQQKTQYSYNNYDTNEYRLGKQYKDKLKLSSQEVAWLNKIWNPTNVFLSIEGCLIETINLYLSTLKKLSRDLKKKNTTIIKEIEFFQSEILKLYQYNSQNTYLGGYDNAYLKERAENELFSIIFKRVENTVREAFGHKRKISTEFPYSDQFLIEEFEQRIGIPVDQILQKLTDSISNPDEETEIELNEENVNRWKIKFEELKMSFTETNKQSFIDGIYAIGKINKKNPSIENIFFEASKFIAKFDKLQALKFYIYYLYYDLKSERVDNKQLTKTIQKNLFSTNDQLRDFEKVVADLVKNRDLNAALEEVVKIYQIKRKKIKLSVSTIEEVKQQDKETVELLGEYLKDEFEDENTRVKAEEINQEEIVLDISSKEKIKQKTAYADGISLNEIQINAIVLFKERSFSVSAIDIENFCKIKGVFKNQLIDSINESCFETLDDVLIDEDGDNFILNENYYKKISQG